MQESPGPSQGELQQTPSAQVSPPWQSLVRTHCWPIAPDPVGVRVGVAVGVFVTVGVDVAVPVLVGVPVDVGVFVTVGVFVGVLVGV